MRASDAWTEVVAIVREAAESSGYAGPSPQSVERIGEDIAATKAAITHWMIAVASKRRLRRLRVEEMQAIRAALGPPTADLQNIAQPTRT